MPWPPSLQVQYGLRRLTPLEQQHLYVGPPGVAAAPPSLFQGMEMVPEELKGGFKVGGFLTFQCLAVSTGVGGWVQPSPRGAAGQSSWRPPALSPAGWLVPHRGRGISTASVCAASGPAPSAASTCPSLLWSASPTKTPAGPQPQRTALAWLVSEALRRRLQGRGAGRGSGGGGQPFPA